MFYLGPILQYPGLQLLRTGVMQSRCQFLRAKTFFEELNDLPVEVKRLEHIVRGVFSFASLSELSRQGPPGLRFLEEPSSAVLSPLFPNPFHQAKQGIAWLGATRQTSMPQRPPLRLSLWT